MKLKVNPVTGKLDLIDGLEDEMKDVQSAIRYSNDEPIVEAHGGVRKGETFSEVPICEMLNKILYPPKPPLIKSLTGNNTRIFHKGFETVIPNLSCKVEKKSFPLEKIIWKKGNSAIAEQSANAITPQSGIYNFNYNDTEDVLIDTTTYSVVVSDVDHNTYTDPETGATKNVTDDSTASIPFKFEYPLIVCGIDGTYSDSQILDKVKELSNTATYRVVGQTKIDISTSAAHTTWRIFASVKPLKTALLNGSTIYTGFTLVGERTRLGTGDYYVYRTYLADNKTTTFNYTLTF